MKTSYFLDNKLLTVQKNQDNSVWVSKPDSISYGFLKGGREWVFQSPHSDSVLIFTLDPSRPAGHAITSAIHTGRGRSTSPNAVAKTSSFVQGARVVYASLFQRGILTAPKGSVHAAVLRLTRVR